MQNRNRFTDMETNQGYQSGEGQIRGMGLRDANNNECRKQPGYIVQPSER